VTLVDDSIFASRTLRNWLWTTFTRSNPAVDVGGIGAHTDDKHWGCTGSLIIDARIKPHHAPPLIEDPNTTAKVDAMAARGEPISKYL
jgi:4-hydroxy-3-polyprenylbenzoate decarboxylase